MKTRFPLYLKILLWFFLNLVFLVAVFAVLAQVQFQFGWNSLIAGPAGDHLQDVVHLLSGQLALRARVDWDSLLKDYDNAYHVKFYLFHNAPGQLEQLAGETVDLPPEVRQRMQSRPGMNPPPRGNAPGQPPGADGNPDNTFPPPREGGPPPQRGGPPPRFMMHEAGRYWVVMPVPAVATNGFGLEGPPPKYIPLPGNAAISPHPSRLRYSSDFIPLPASIVISSATLSAGGLFFNPTPWILAALAVIVVSTLFWIPLVRGITHSLSRMTAATEQIAEGRFDVRTRVRRRDELGALSGAIDQMAGRLSGLVGGQKRFLGDIAHELCSPIARIQVALGILEQRADESQKARLDDLREEVEQMSSLVNELLSFSRASLGKASVKLQPVALRTIAEKAVARECGPDTGAKVAIDISEDLTALAEPELLLRALANVLRNAVRYAAAAGPIRVSANRADDMISLQVEDSGPGVPESALPQLFDPFYRVDSSRTRDTGGTGLGLSIVKTCVESCDGTVACENLRPSGLRVTIRLPAAQ